MNLKPRLGIYTPIDDLPDLMKRFHDKFEVLYLPEANYQKVKSSISQIEFVFTNPNKQHFVFDRELLSCAKKMKVFATASTGINHVDSTYLIENKIKFINLRNEKDLLEQLTSTAELAFLMLLAGIRNFIPAIESVRQGKWNYEPYTGQRLQDLKIGVIGFGRLGKMFSQYCGSFGAQIFVFDPYLQSVLPYDRAHSIEEIFENCDAVSLHIHSDPSNLKLINKNILKLTGNRFVLINTSRGEIIDEEDVINWVGESEHRMYFTDVLSQENKNLHHNLILKATLNNRQIIVSPHIGGMTMKGREIAYNFTANQLIDCVSGLSN